jgi:hypothetical protein
MENPDITFRYIPKSEFDKAPAYFLEVYTKAWGGHKGVKPMDIEGAKKIFKKLKPIADPKLIWFGFYKEQPIAFYISIPELNQLFKHVDGNMNWWGKLKFLYHKLRGRNTKMLGIVFGVVPEWHGKGIETRHRGGVLQAHLGRRVALQAGGDELDRRFQPQDDACVRESGRVHHPHPRHLQVSI